MRPFSLYYRATRDKTSCKNDFFSQNWTIYLVSQYHFQQQVKNCGSSHSLFDRPFRVQFVRSHLPLYVFEAQASVFVQTLRRYHAVSCVQVSPNQESRDFYQLTATMKPVERISCILYLIHSPSMSVFVWLLKIKLCVYPVRWSYLYIKMLDHSLATNVKGLIEQLLTSCCPAKDLLTKHNGFETTNLMRFLHKGELDVRHMNCMTSHVKFIIRCFWNVVRLRLTCIIALF